MPPTPALFVLNLDTAEQIPMSMGQTSFVDVLLCPDIQESEIGVDDQEGGLLMVQDGDLDNRR